MKQIIKRAKKYTTVIGYCFVSILLLTACSLPNEVKLQLNDALSSHEEPDIVSSISEELYVYQQLSEEEKIVYDQIVQLLMDHRESATVSSDSTDVAKKAFHAVITDHPEIFWSESFSITSHFVDDELDYLEIMPDYTMTQEERTEYQAKIDDYTQKCLAGIADTDSSYQKAKYIYDYIVRNTDYVEASEHNQNICSVMVNHASVCMGYTRTMQYLLKEAGILSTTVSGNANNGSHAWNLVCLDDVYYYIDVTWGDMQLEGDTSANIDVDYSYFCITTEELLKTHTPDAEFQLQECVSNTHNYYVHEGLYLEQFDTDSIKQMIEKQQTDEISIKCVNANIYQQLCNYLLTEGHIYDYVDRNSINYVENQELNILTIL